jgi:hypothetical protein
MSNAVFQRRDDADPLELLELPPPPPLPPPPFPPPPPDDELGLLELLDPVDDEDELELEGVEDDELDEDVLEVLGAAELDELELGLVELEDEPSGPAGLPFSQPMVATSPIAIAPPLSRRRKSRRSDSFPVPLTSMGRSFWLAMGPDSCNPAAMAPSLTAKRIRPPDDPGYGPNPRTGRRYRTGGVIGRASTSTPRRRSSPLRFPRSGHGARRRRPTNKGCAAGSRAPCSRRRPASAPTRPA